VALTVAGLLGFEVHRPSFEAGGLALGVGTLLAAAATLAVRWGGALGAPPSATTVTRLATPRYVWLTPAIAALGAFSWALTLGPLSDDFVRREWAVEGQWLPESWPFVRPLPLAMWQALIAAGGDWWLLHAVNLSAHALNSARLSHASAPAGRDPALAWLQACCSRAFPPAPKLWGGAPACSTYWLQLLFCFPSVFGNRPRPPHAARRP